MSWLYLNLYLPFISIANTPRYFLPLGGVHRLLVILDHQGFVFYCLPVRSSEVDGSSLILFVFVLAYPLVLAPWAHYSGPYWRVELLVYQSCFVREHVSPIFVRSPRWPVLVDQPFPSAHPSGIAAVRPNPQWVRLLGYHHQLKGTTRRFHG